MQIIKSGPTTDNRPTRWKFPMRKWPWRAMSSCGSINELRLKEAESPSLSADPATVSSLSPMFPLQDGSHNDRVWSHHCSSEQPPLHGSPPYPPSVSEVISIHSRLL